MNVNTMEIKDFKDIPDDKKHEYIEIPNSDLPNVYNMSYEQKKEYLKKLKEEYINKLKGVK